MSDLYSDSNALRDVFLGISMGGDPAGAYDTMVKVSQEFASGKIPAHQRLLDALTAWGIEYEECSGISRMFTTDAAVKIKLPKGWKFSTRGGGGHNNLLDATGASRLWWHIHPHDSISTRVDYRYGVRREVSLSATDSVIHVYDGEIPIHTVQLKYPHPRINDPLDDGTPFWKSGWEEDGWTKEMSSANYEAQEAASKEARTWLDENRPNHRDALASWED